MERTKIEIKTLRQKKRKGDKIVMLTAYDYPSAKVLDEEGVDVILVGDSLSNVVLGYSDTRPVTMEEMLHHTKAVSRAVEYAFVLGDMPFMSYNVSLPEAIRNAGRFIKEAGTDAVKMEGGGWVVDRVRHVVAAGIPVCGHLGLTPQTASLLGGHRVQGKQAAKAAKLVEDALRLEDAGVFMLVCELVPDRVAALIAERVSVPVIGIGAGPDCDGQVLVYHDMLGINADFQPRFLKKYANLDKVIREAVQGYRADVLEGVFPTAEQSFTISDQEYAKLSAMVSAGPSGGTAQGSGLDTQGGSDSQPGVEDEDLGGSPYGSSVR